ENIMQARACVSQFTLIAGTRSGAEPEPKRTLRPRVADFSQSLRATKSGPIRLLRTQCLFGVLEPRADRNAVASRLRQLLGLGLILLVDLALTGQVPMLFRPRIHSRFVHIGRGGARP